MTFSGKRRGRYPPLHCFLPRRLNCIIRLKNIPICIIHGFIRRRQTATHYMMWYFHVYATWELIYLHLVPSLEFLRHMGVIQFSYVSCIVFFFLWPCSGASDVNPMNMDEYGINIHKVLTIQPKRTSHNKAVSMIVGHPVHRILYLQ